MPTLTVDINYNINEELVFSPRELQDLYLYGINIVDRSGQALDNNTYKHFVKAASKEIEHFLSIKLKKQIISENQDYYQDNFRNWGHIDTQFPVVKAFSLIGRLGTVTQLRFPIEWLTSRKTSDGVSYYRRIFLVPVQTYGNISMHGVAVLYAGMVPYTLIMSERIPNYYFIEYCTGFDEIPADLLDVIGKLAAIGIFNVAGDIVLGQAALAGYSLSIDGLHQSIQTTNSAENAAFSARIKNYQKEIKSSLDNMKSFYKGIICTSM